MRWYRSPLKITRSSATERSETLYRKLPGIFYARDFTNEHEKQVSRSKCSVLRKESAPRASGAQATASPRLEILPPVWQTRFAVPVGLLRTAYAYLPAAAGSGYTPALSACEMIKRTQRGGRAKSPVSGPLARKQNRRAFSKLEARTRLGLVLVTFGAGAGSRGTRQQGRCCGATRRSRRLRTWPQHAATSACLLHSAHALESLKETKMPSARALARVV